MSAERACLFLYACAIFLCWYACAYMLMPVWLSVYVVPACWSLYAERACLSLYAFALFVCLYACACMLLYGCLCLHNGHCKMCLHACHYVLCLILLRVFCLYACLYMLCQHDGLYMQCLYACACVVILVCCAWCLCWYDVPLCLCLIVVLVCCVPILVPACPCLWLSFWPCKFVIHATCVLSGVFCPLMCLIHKYIKIFKLECFWCHNSPLGHLNTNLIEIWMKFPTCNHTFMPFWEPLSAKCPSKLCTLPFSAHSTSSFHSAQYILCYLGRWFSWNTTQSVWTTDSAPSTQQFATH